MPAEQARLPADRILGVVPHDRPFLSFGSIMDFMTEQLKAAAVPFKIKDNVLTEKGELFQTYVFDRAFDGPDGEKLVPMIIARANYLNRPLDLDFGSYRFVCRNGVMLGNTIGRIRIGTKQTSDLARLSFQNQFEMAFERTQSRRARLSGKQRHALSVLNLDYPFTQAQLKSRYRELVKRHHPDRNPEDPKAAERFQRVQAAYECLRDGEYSG